MIKRWLKLGLVSCLLACCSLAQAELWGYVDGAGVAHFAPSPLSSRYGLVMGEARDAGRVPGKVDATSSLLTWLEISPVVKALRPWLLEAATRYGVDVELLLAMIAVESGFDAAAVSKRGAIGLMQITAETADRYATEIEARRPAERRLLDPRTNIRTGARILADLMRRFGRIDEVVAAWNAGEGRVRRHGGGVPPIVETQAHVQMVLELYWALLQRSLPSKANLLVMHTAALTARP
jgi:soluble lytic murein transglycosylase-like protein